MMLALLRERVSGRGQMIESRLFSCFPPLGFRHVLGNHRRCWPNHTHHAA